MSLDSYVCMLKELIVERSGSVVERMTRDLVVAGSNLTGGTVLCPQLSTGSTQEDPSQRN